MTDISQLIQASIDTKEKLLESTEILQTIKKVAEVTANALQQGNKALFCGNGGSAADAQHIAAELSGRF